MRLKNKLDFFYHFEFFCHFSWVVCSKVDWQGWIENNLWIQSTILFDKLLTSLCLTNMEAWNIFLAWLTEPVQLSHLTDLIISLTRLCETSKVKSMSYLNWSLGADWLKPWKSQGKMFCICSQYQQCACVCVCVCVCVSLCVWVHQPYNADPPLYTAKGQSAEGYFS